MNMILSVLRMVRIYNAKIVLPVIGVFIFIGNAYSSELKQPREGDIYQTSRGEFVIKILSPRQLEFVRSGLQNKKQIWKNCFKTGEKRGQHENSSDAGKSRCKGIA